jgi:hypothetical protein
MSEDEIEALVARLGSLAATLRDADPADKSEMYRQLGLRLAYQPGQQIVHGAIDLETPGHWFPMVSEGLEPLSR